MLSQSFWCLVLSLGLSTETKRLSLCENPNQAALCGGARVELTASWSQPDELQIRKCPAVNSGNLDSGP